LKLLDTQGPAPDLPDTIAITAPHWIAQAATAQVPVTLTSDDLMLAGISLRAHDTIQGVLGIGTRTQRQFTPAELDRLTASSHLAAMALENARLYARIQTMALTDGLTGLYNYRHFFDELHREMARARRHDIPLSLLILDIDHFKKFNDTFGHVQGDEVLRMVARTLWENIRGSDLAARYGGEEFAAILPGAGPTQARRVAERIRRRIMQTVFHSDTQITVSIGVASLGTGRDTEESPRSFAHRADQALYRAKQTGRNRVCVYEEHVSENDDNGGDDP
jgi:diguanylate cyclase (GGDEF)-like protein